jgi:hypothetical protein
MNITVEELLSSQELYVPFADIAPKFVYGEDLVSEKMLSELPTHMRNLHQWYKNACQRNENWIIGNIPIEYYFRREDIHIEICELWQLFNLDALDKSFMSVYCA